MAYFLNEIRYQFVDAQTTGGSNESIKTSYKIKMAVIALAMVVGFSGIIAMPAHSHGGKTHGEETFTALQALQKATQLFDRLIASGKLPGEWETGLKTIKIDTRNSAEKREYVVQFERAKGNPISVYFFFNQDGEYSGSNFTGK